MSCKNTTLIKINVCVKEIIMKRYKSCEQRNYWKINRYNELIPKI